MKRIPMFTFAATLLLAIALSAPASLAQDCVCQLQDLGTGTIQMPPACIDGYVGPMQIATGIPGGTIQIAASLHDFIQITESPGGDLGGTFSTFWSADLEMEMTGTGTLSGYNRSIRLDIAPVPGGRMDWGPRTANDAVQTFPNQLSFLTGSLFGDPDFGTLTFISGTHLGYPTAGSTTLTRVGGVGTDFVVDSFFDLEYDIVFQGLPGSPLEGMGGTHADFTRISVCGAGPVPVQAHDWGAIKALYRD